MALYVPQLGDLSAASGVRSLRESYVRAAQEARERDRDMAERLRYGDQQKRQRIQDRNAALAEASKLWATDKPAAMAIMAPYKGQMEQYEVDAPQDWAPRLNQGELDFADTLPMNRPGGPVAQQPQAQPRLPPGEWIPLTDEEMQQDQVAMDPMRGTNGAIDHKWGANNKHGYTEYQKGPDGRVYKRWAPSTVSQPGDDATPSGAQSNPVVAAYQASQQRNKVMAQRLKGQFEDGTPWSIDPDAGRRESLARADKAFYDASGEDTPEAEQVREQYPQLRATYQAAGQDIDPKQVFTQFRADAAGQRQEQAATERERMRLEAEERRNAEWDRRFPLLEAGRDRRSMNAAANRGAMVEQGEKRLDLSTEGSAREAASRILSNLGAKEQILADRKYSDMLHNLTANKNAALDAATSGQWVKLAQGGTGVISDSDMDVFWKRIGGVGQRVDGEIQNLINGQIATGKREVVADAVRELAGRAQTNLDGIRKSMEFHFDSSPNLAPYKDQMVGTYFPRARAKIQDKRAISKARRGNLDRDLEDL